MLLAVGLLGLASTAALITGMIVRSRQMTQAGAIGNQRLEILRSTPCSQMEGGETNVRHFQITWEVSPLADERARELRVEVEWPAGRRDVFYGYVLC